VFFWAEALIALRRLGLLREVAIELVGHGARALEIFQLGLGIAQLSPAAGRRDLGLQSSILRASDSVFHLILDQMIGDSRWPDCAPGGFG